MNKDDLSSLRAAFAAFLREARESKGFSSQQASQRMGVTDEIIEEWECGKRPIDLVELRAYCQAIDLPLDKCIAFLEAVLETISDDRGKNTEQGGR